MTPVDFSLLNAAALAWPLCSRGALARGDRIYRAEDFGRSGTPTFEMRNEFVECYLPRAPGRTIRDITDVCLLAWFREAPQIDLWMQLEKVVRSEHGETRYARLMIAPPLLAAAGYTAPVAALLGPTAETHVHAGGAVPWSELWLRTLQNEKAPDGKFPDGRVIRQMVACAGLIKAALEWRTKAVGRVGIPLDDVVRALAAEHAQDAVDFGMAFQHAKDAISGKFLFSLDSYPSNIYRVCATLYRSVTWGAGTETKFMKTARDNLWQKHEGELATYMRLGCCTHNWLTHEPGTAGLQWFARAFSRRQVFSRGSGVSEFEPILREVLETAPAELRSWEGRKTPDKDKIEATVRQFAHAAMNVWDEHGTAMDFGLLFHADKRGPPEQSSMLMSHVRNWYIGVTDAAKELAGFIERYPWSLAVLRGIDVCGDELAVPTWAVVPFFHLVNAQAQLAAKSLDALKNVKPAFGRTAHAGEDYRTVAEGVRRIWELVHYGIIGRGDRLGHCLALFDTDGWHDRALQPKHERLDDLLWLLQLSTKRTRATHQPLKNEAERLIVEIYPPSLRSIEDHHAAQRLRFDDSFVRDTLRYDQPGNVDCPGYPAAAIVWHYLFDGNVHERGSAIDWVLPSLEEQQLLRRATLLVQNTILRKQITIESNPTSNQFLRGGLIAPKCHPVAAPRAQRIAVSLSTDDPTFFATTLAEEHSRADLMLSSAKAPYAAKRRGDLASAGLRSKFTLSAELSKRILGENLLRSDGVSPFPRS